MINKIELNRKTRKLLSEYIDNLLKEKNLSKLAFNQLSIEKGDKISINTIRDVCDGTGSGITFITFARILNILDIDIEQFFKNK